MITIDLDSGGDELGLSTRRARAVLDELLDRCETENLRDLVLRFPAVIPRDVEECLDQVLARPFRFQAWFRTPPPLPLAERFVSAGHRILLAGTIPPDVRVLPSLLSNPVFGLGKPEAASLFLAWPVPAPGLSAAVEGMRLRAGANVTLGVGWAHPESGPRPLSDPDAASWTDCIPPLAEAWTERGITVHFACGLPLCLFSTEQLGKLALSRIRHPLAACDPSLEVTLDGRARACPRLPAAGWAPLPPDASLIELRDRLVAGAGFFAAFCGHPGEAGCRSLATGACGGGCRAQNALAWRGSAGPTGE